MWLCRCCNGKCLCCCRKRSSCVLITLAVVTLLIFFLYPREVEISFPIKELEKLLELENGNDITFDLLTRSFIVKTNWPVGVKNDNFVPVYADVKQLELYYPGVDEAAGCHIASASADDFKMPVLSETTNWVEIDADVSPSLMEQVRMSSVFTADCSPCALLPPKDCTHTTSFYIHTVLHINKMGNVLPDIKYKGTVDVSCRMLWPCEEGDPCDGR